ncbi:class I SAM-dependent methyltransferase [Schleiferiaceae bacterium]|jgi:caffeoyl-CoA O-methyltransferase|nr:methyltransferase [Flavobacteriales bacterium]MDC1022505.1 class I SAM-dependent methyltransferase [Schleiferiaceae bacterium]|tara:strand:- start:1697 stop:2338 length:642 start_codon:yes stop_codon:yes gene_type:complete
MEFISDEIQKYISDHTTKAPEYLNELERETWLKVIMPRMLSGHVQGQLLKLFTLMKRPKYILEVGTFTGYASHYLVEGLKEQGEFHAIEINEELESTILKYWKQHPKFAQMNLHIGPAEKKLKEVQRPWDFIFLDADKKGLLEYYETLIPLMPTGGIMLIDNILWSGKVVEELASKDKDTKSIMSLNKHIARDTRVEQVILSVRDGIMMVSKL